MKAIQFLIALAIQFICSQSLSCGCVSVELSGVTQGAAVAGRYCYTYSITKNSSCSYSGDVTLDIPVDTGSCNVSALELENLVAFSSQTVTYEDNAIQRDITSTSSESLMLCIDGTEAATVSLSGSANDNDTQCSITMDALDVCAICDGSFSNTTCFCNEDETDCLSSPRPTGDLECSWSSEGAGHCEAILAEECATPYTTDTPCVCFTSASWCESGEGSPNQRTDCDWDSDSGLCYPDDCVPTDLSCGCYEIDGDCYSAPLVDVACTWDADEDECIELVTTFEPTSDPTDMPSLQPTTSEPTTSEPTTSEPTPSPSTAEPSTAEPTTAEPTSEPSTAEPTTSQPTTPAPSTSTAEPTTPEPSTSEPSTSEPSTSEPSTSEPSTSEPSTAEPTTLQPTTSDPTTAQPTTSEPTATTSPQTTSSTTTTTTTTTTTAGTSSTDSLTSTVATSEEPCDDDKDKPKETEEPCDDEEDSKDKPKQTEEPCDDEEDNKDKPKETEEPCDDDTDTNSTNNKNNNNSSSSKSNSSGSNDYGSNSSGSNSSGSNGSGSNSSGSNSNGGRH